MSFRSPNVYTAVDKNDANICDISSLYFDGLKVIYFNLWSTRKVYMNGSNFYTAIDNGEAWIRTIPQVLTLNGFDVIGISVLVKIDLIFVVGVKSSMYEIS